MKNTSQDIFGDYNSETFSEKSSDKRTYTYVHNRTFLTILH